MTAEDNTQVMKDTILRLHGQFQPSARMHQRVTVVILSVDLSIC